MAHEPIVVVGAGLGGLAAAVRMAAHGHPVTVVEAAEQPGGKAGEVVVDGVGFDTGPSVLTLVSILRDLLAEAGVDLRDELELTEPDPAFRYLWPDGTQLDIRPTVEGTAAEVGRTLGAEAEQDFVGFMAYSRRLWEEAAPWFVLADAPTVGRLASVGPKGWLAATRIDPFRTMSAAIEAQVRSPHLRDVFERFATYNGSDPRRAPATLNCIAHVEMGLGAHGVEGGIHALVRTLVRVAERMGVHFRYGCSVQRLEIDGGRVAGVRLASGERLPAADVVVNADVAHLVADLLPEPATRGLTGDHPPSTSGWTAVVRVPADASRAGHTAIFPARYREEFEALFEAERPPDDPTVYVCDQAIAHRRVGWVSGHVPVFLMVNAPAEPADGHSVTDWADLRQRALARAEAAGVIPSNAEVVWQRSPTGLASRFPGSRGSLYGAASNNLFAAFRRPPNRLPRVPGLYLASGSAHPGGGMPLCLQSGRLAAGQLLARRRRGAA